jgi:predicted HicB family RNase H-like nuclease
VATRGCTFWLTQIAVGCMGMLLGSALVVGAQIYAAFKVTEQVAAIAEAQRAMGPSQRQYDAMCASGAEARDPTLKKICERMRKELAAKRATEAAGNAVKSTGDNQHGSGMD